MVNKSQYSLNMDIQNQKTEINSYFNNKGKTRKTPQHKKYQMWSFFWSVFSCIWTQYRDLHCKSLYSVLIWQDLGQKKLSVQWIPSEEQKIRRGIRIRKMKILWRKFQILYSLTKIYSRLNFHTYHDHLIKGNFFCQKAYWAWNRRRYIGAWR